jgi:hypothetical protein
MSINQVVEVAGIRLLVEGVKLAANYSNFLTKDKPDFFFCCNDLTNRAIALADIYDIEAGPDILITSKNGQINIVNLYRGQLFEIGLIDINRKKAVFNRYSPDITDIFLSPFLRACYQIFLACNGGLCAHACGVELNGKGYLFPGVSGAGKTTMASMRPNDAQLLSDEFIFLRKIEEKTYIYSTPWRSHRKYAIELDTIFFLKQAKSNCLRVINKADAVMALLPAILYCFSGDRLMTSLLKTICDISDNVECAYFDFALSPNPWELLCCRK